MKKLLITGLIVLLLSGCSAYGGFTSLLSENAEVGDTSEMPYDTESGKGINTDYNYFYSILDNDEKDLYNIIYNAIMSHSQAVRLNNIDYDTLDYCFNCVLRDHPEIYFVYGYTYSQNRFTEKINEFTPNYSFTADELEYCDSGIKRYVDEFMTDAPVNGDDYQKVKYVYEYVAKHVTYDADIISNQSIYGAFVSKRCACNGYAKAVQYLCNKIGIRCILVVGEADNGKEVNSHAWNIADVNGAWYQLDATWADRKYKAGDTVVSDVVYDYLCTNDDIMYADHMADDFTDYPKCTSLDQYYYVKENSYISTVEGADFSAAFETATAEGKNYVIFKCKSADVLEDLKTELMSNNKIFEYVDAREINSSEYRENDIIIFIW